jgi:hypothetical protein
MCAAADTLLLTVPSSSAPITTLMSSKPSCSSHSGTGMAITILRDVRKAGLSLMDRCQKKTGLLRTSALPSQPDELIHTLEGEADHWVLSGKV